MFGKKLKSASDLMKPMLKTIQNLKANQVVRGEKMAVNNTRISALENENRAHKEQIQEAQNYIDGFTKTFNLESK